MNIAELSIKKKTVTLFFTILLIGGGLVAFDKLGRLEDPEFTIKDALVYTAYPGATALQVEEEVTEKLETAIQQLPQLKRVESLSKNDLSTITVTIKDKYNKQSLAQVWDELRRKVNDAQKDLPPGAQPSIVFDDFGDVYGILFALTGPGYTYKELEEYADFLRRELLLVKDVAKVQIYAVQPREVHVEISRDKLAQMNMTISQIHQTLQEQNTVQPAGALQIGSEYIRLRPTGQFKSVEEIGNILLKGRVSDRTVYLKDIATITEGYHAPPEVIARYNDQPSLWIGISITSGGNVVTMGENVKNRLAELADQAPLGMQLHTITYQPDNVTSAINGFLVSLMQALAIVIGVLMIFMGLKSGLLIGIVLLLTVLGTFLGMQLWGINLERISLGALIIALGMLVDNAIVITEGILVKIEAGEDKLNAAKNVVAQTAFPLLSATFIAILAFAAIGLSQDSTGEYTRSLFQVILISLLLSWVIAITVTPLFCTMIFKPKKTKSGETAEPYQGVFFKSYKYFLHACLKLRWFTLITLVVCLGAAIVGFSYIEQSFFPNSTRPQFLVHYWLPEGTDIRQTTADTQKFSQYLRTLEGVTSVATYVGSGAPRFVLTYSPEKTYPSYAIMIVNVNDYRNIDSLFPKIEAYAEKNFVKAMVKPRKFVLGPSAEDSLEFRFSGPRPTVLRELAEKAKHILQKEPGVVGIKDNWRERVKVIKPQYAEAQARLAGIGKEEIDQSLQMNFSGIPVGIYRDQDKLLHILVRAPENERDSIDDINNVQVWKAMIGSHIPLTQITRGNVVSWEDAVIQRRDRKRTITVQGSQKTGNASVVLNQVLPEIQQIELPLGYEFSIGGEYEDAKDAKAALFSSIPTTVVLVIALLIMQFNALRQPFIIILTVPLAIIGVTIGLLVTHQSFGFMALLGFLSLAGMLIKNAIVLIDQIDLEIVEGKDPYRAILDSSVSRMRPVLMAAITTVLGMIPLLPDVFFVSMAVTIMAGLTFATLLTLIVVPILYAILFRIRSEAIY